jgi:hypothetical protein
MAGGLFMRGIMGTGVDRKYARDHAAKLLDDQLAGTSRTAFMRQVCSDPLVVLSVRRPTP